MTQEKKKKTTTTKIGKYIIKIFNSRRIRSLSNPDPPNAQELRLIVSGARDSGSIENSEGEMIQAVLDLQDQKIREVMTPRVEIVAIPSDMSVANALGVIRESGYSRIPVYEGEKQYHEFNVGAPATALGFYVSIFRFLESIF